MGRVSPATLVWLFRPTQRPRGCKCDRPGLKRETRVYGVRVVSRIMASNAKDGLTSTYYGDTVYRSCLTPGPAISLLNHAPALSIPVVHRKAPSNALGHALTLHNALDIIPLQSTHTRRTTVTTTVTPNHSDTLWMITGSKRAERAA